jgi:hypothetical protein
MSCPNNTVAKVNPVLMRNPCSSPQRFIFDLATPEDSAELLEILEDATFQGNIALLYTRRPDPYMSLKKEGEQVDIVVCRDTDKGKIVGFGACVLRKLFVNGQAENVGYLFGLRIRREYLRKYPLLHRGYDFLYALHHEQDIPCYLTTILTDNRYVQKLLEKRRPFMPSYMPYGSYEVYALKIPKASSRARPQLRPAQKSDIPALVQFLNEYGSQSQFFPVIEAKILEEGSMNGITTTDFYLLCDEHEKILAAGVLWDQTAYKQYLVQGYMSR